MAGKSTLNRLELSKLESTRYQQHGIKEAGQQLGVLRERWPLAFPVQAQDVRPLALGIASQIGGNGVVASLHAQRASPLENGGGLPRRACP